MTKTDRERQRKAPILRFKGFTDAWEQRKLSDFAHIIVGGTPSTKKNEYWNGNIPWMSSGEVNKKRIYKTDKSITKLGLENSSAKFVPENSVLIALAGQGKTRGKVAVNNIELTINQSLAGLIPTSGSYYEFIFYNLEKRYSELRRLSSGAGSRGGLNKKLIQNIKVQIPNLREQTLISKLSETLDKVLTLYERKYQLYLLQFQKLQRVIFDNSDDFISLSSLIEIKTGNRNSQDNVKNGKYVFFDRSTEIKKLNEFDFDEEAIIIPGEGTKFAPKYVNGKYALHQRSYSLYNFSQEIDSKYLYYFLMTQSNTLLRYSVGTTVPSLRVSTFDHIKVPMYSKELQMKYASTFDSLEKLLSQIKEKTNILRSLKQFLLQVLFL